MSPCLRSVTWLALLAVLCCACKVFDSTCDEADRSCLGGGLARSGESCVRSGDCATGMACRANTCIYAGESRTGAACVASAECEDGSYCSSELRCSEISLLAVSAGGACGDSSDCEAGLACDLNLGTALERGPFGALNEFCQGQVETLEQFPQCALPLTCVARGKRDFGASCTTNADCLAGLYCTPSPVEGNRAPICLGGVELDTEPVSAPSWAGVTCPAEASDPTAYFEVPGSGNDDSDFYRLPFPNDVRRRAGTVDLADHPRPPDGEALDVAARFIDVAAAQDGFATNPVAYFRFSVPFSTGNLSRKTARIVDITPASPEYNADASIAWGPPERESKYICPHWLALYRPVGTPLRPGTTYTALVTRELRAKDGQEYARSADFEAMLSPNKPGNATRAAAWQAYAPLRDWLADPTIDFDPESLLNAAVFTTQNPPDLIQKLRAAVIADDSPTVKDLTLCDDDTVSPCAATERGECHPASDVVAEWHGRLTIPLFQDGTLPFERPEDGGDLVLDGQGRPRVIGHADVCFALALPKQESAPAEGWPLVLYAHDIGGVFNEAFTNGLAPAIAAATGGSALLSLDLPMHGARRGDSQRSPHDLFANLQNPAALRGNTLQGVADLYSAARLAFSGIPAEQTPNGEAIKFNSQRVALFAHGQGATDATLALAYFDEIRTAVLAAVGGHWGSNELARTKPTAIDRLLPILLVDPDDHGDLVGGVVNPMLALAQSALDVIDPINYARQLVQGPDTGRDVFVVYGRHDHFTSEAAQEAFGKAAGLRAVTPDLTDKWTDIEAPALQNFAVGEQLRTVGLGQYDPEVDTPIAEGATLDGHFVASTLDRAGTDIVRFLRQAQNGEPPQIGE